MHLFCSSTTCVFFELFPKSAICVFLGYGAGQKGYHCFDPVSQKLYVSRHVVFLEHIPLFSVPASSHHMAQSDLIRIDPFDVEIEETPPIALEPVPDITLEPVPDITPEPIPDTTPEPVASIHRLQEPLSYREAICDPLWQNAMAEELAALDQTHTWDLVLLPPGKHTIGSCWVYKIKTKSDGSVERYKAQFVTKGYCNSLG